MATKQAALTLLRSLCLPSASGRTTITSNRLLASTQLAITNGLLSLAQCNCVRQCSSLPSHTELAMPALSPTMSQGNIAKWYVKEGDEVSAGSVLADIETDKATMSFENQEDGYVAKILKPEGSKDVPVGEPVAIIVEDKESVPAFANYTGAAASAGGDATASITAGGQQEQAASASASSSSSPSETSQPAAAAAAASSSSGSYPDYIGLQMPALSPTMERGNIISWAVQEGDEVQPGSILGEIETDKATLAFENQDEGYVAKIVAPAGSKDVKVGDLVAILVENKEDIPKFADFQTGGGPSEGKAAPAATAGADKQAATATATAEAAPRRAANFRLGPAARFALAQAGLSTNDVNPTGPNNIITKPDVMAAKEAGAKPKAAAAAPAAKPEAAKAAAQPAAPKAERPAAPAAPAAKKPAPAGPATGQYEDIPNSQIRKIIAERLLMSKKTIPSIYMSADAQLDQINALRKSMAASGNKVSVNDFVIKAVAMALRDVPQANAFWDANAGDAVVQPNIDISIAVATDKGLITPIVKDAAQKPLLQISKEVKDLAARARANKLKPEEFQGGTFSISNLGMYGLTYFSAIINPPQAAIMAVGGSHQEVTLGQTNGSRPVAQSVMTVTISADNRVYDGEVGSQFLEAFCGYMANPVTMLV